MTQTEPEPIYKTACGGALKDPSNSLLRKINIKVSDDIPHKPFGA